MAFELLPAGERIAVPWRNGGGRTRQVAVSPSGPSDFRWRISIADVAADGPFSAFPGYQRIIMMLSGAGMALTVDGVTTTVDRSLQPFGFSGGAATTCRLMDGPIVDFNVISTPDEQARVEVLHGPITLVAVGAAVVVNLAGAAVVGGFALGPLDGVRIGREPSVAIEGGPVAVVRFRNPDH